MRETLTIEEQGYVVGVGLRLRVFDLAEVKEWAYRKIGEEAEPAYWLLELATAQDLSSENVRRFALRHIPEPATDRVCGVMLAMVPPLTEVSADRIFCRVELLRQLVFQICGWQHVSRVLDQIEKLDTTIALIHSEYLPQETLRELQARVAIFLHEFSLPDLVESLVPMQLYVKRFSTDQGVYL